MDAPKTLTNLQRAAQIWCEPVHRNKVMDVEMAESIAKALDEKDAALLEADKNGYERGRKEDEALLRECRTTLRALLVFRNDAIPGAPIWTSLNVLVLKIEKRLTSSVVLSDAKEPQ